MGILVHLVVLHLALPITLQLQRDQPNVLGLAGAPGEVVRTPEVDLERGLAFAVVVGVGGDVMAVPVLVAVEQPAVDGVEPKTIRRVVGVQALALVLVQDYGLRLQRLGAGDLALVAVVVEAQRSARHAVAVDAGGSGGERCCGREEELEVFHTVSRLFLSFLLSVFD